MTYIVKRELVSNVYFCRTTHHYQPYDDFFRLVELSGFPIINVDAIDIESDNTYIVTPLNGQWNQGWRNPRARIIHYDLEWRLDGDYPVVPGIAETWTGDQWYANRIGARYVPIYSHPGLTLRPVTAYANRKTLYDLALLMYREPHRRARVLNELRAANVSTSPDGWDGTRHLSLITSRAFLFVHQHDHALTIAPLRYALAAAYQMPIVSENVWHSGVFDNGQDVVYTSYAELTKTVKALVREPKRLSELSMKLYDKMCVTNTFKKGIDAAL